MTAVNVIRSRRSKHIKIADLFVMQAVEDGLLELRRVNSADNNGRFPDQTTWAAEIYPDDQEAGDGGIQKIA